MREEAEEWAYGAIDDLDVLRGRQYKVFAVPAPSDPPERVFRAEDLSYACGVEDLLAGRRPPVNTELERAKKVLSNSRLTFQLRPPRNR